jgi:hypothetical protein
MLSFGLLAWGYCDMADIEAEKKATSNGSFDTVKFGKWLNENAVPKYGKGSCAKHVRMAMEAAGMSTAGRPRSAKDYGQFLENSGFAEVSSQGYIARAGDIIVMSATSRSKDGHVEGFDGKNWISDFIQDDMWPGRSWISEAKYKIYRR